MKKIVFITPSDAEHGFRLAGMTQEVASGDDAGDVLYRAMAEPDNGLIVLDERLLAAVTEERLRKMEEGWHGILLVLPSPEKLPLEHEDYAARLIRRAVGYHVRLGV